MATQNTFALPTSLIIILCCLTSAAASTSVNSKKIKRAYIDGHQNVHIVTTGDHHTQITNKRNATELKLAFDNETIAWLVMNSWIAEGDIRPGSEELVIYRNGKTASIKCSPFIRDYWFWKNGRQVAIDCGGRHFAGRGILYDIRTLKEISSFDQNDVPLEKRPDWSNGSN